MSFFPYTISGLTVFYPIYTHLGEVVCFTASKWEFISVTVQNNVKLIQLLKFGTATDLSSKLNCDVFVDYDVHCYS